MQLRTKMIAIGLASIALGVAAAPAASADLAPSSISVTGTGTATTRATSASFSAGVSVRARSTRVALTLSTRRIRAVRAALLRAGVAATDLTTESVSTYRQDRRHAIAEQTLDVHVDQVARTGRLITVANGAGASSINGPSFAYESTDVAYRTALGRAIADARAKAEAIATIIQKTIDGTLAVSEGGAEGVTPSFGSSTAAADTGKAAPPVPIQPPVSTLEADVVVVYSFH